MKASDSDNDVSLEENNQGGAAAKPKAKPKTRQTANGDKAAMTMEELDNELAKEERAWKRARKEPRQVSYAQEKVLEHDTAVAVGINANQLTEEEEGLLPPGTDEQLYTKVRNHILAKWRADVTRWLTEEEAGAKVEARFRHLVAPAYRFLTAYGYINFGVAPKIAERQLGVAATKESVLVIGAGLAGLAAARQLRAFGHKVVVVEGRDRPGGRVYTKRMEAEGRVAAADLGGSIITGIDGNPLGLLARQLRIPMHDINTSSQGFAIYLDSGAAPDPLLDDQIYREFNSLLDTLNKHRDDMGDIANCLSLGAALDTMWADLYPAAAAPIPPQPRPDPAASDTPMPDAGADTPAAVQPPSSPSSPTQQPAGAPGSPSAAAKPPASPRAADTQMEACPSRPSEEAAAASPGKDAPQVAAEGVGGEPEAAQAGSTPEQLPSAEPAEGGAADEAVGTGGAASEPPAAAAPSGAKADGEEKAGAGDGDQGSPEAAALEREGDAEPGAAAAEQGGPEAADAKPGADAVQAEVEGGSKGEAAASTSSPASSEPAPAPPAAGQAVGAGPQEGGPAPPSSSAHDSPVEAEAGPASAVGRTDRPDTDGPSAPSSPAPEAGKAAAAAGTSSSGGGSGAGSGSDEDMPAAEEVPMPGSPPRGTAGALPSGATQHTLHPAPGLKGSSRLSTSPASAAPPRAPVAEADPVLMRRLYDWHVANVEFANAACATSLSLKSWDLDDPYEFLGPHVFLPGGNLRLVAALADRLPILYRSTVTRLAHSPAGVTAHLHDGSILQADAALVTVPLGVLKAGTLAFEPPLPQRKQDAIRRMGFGLLNKVVMLFPYVFWDDKLDTFGRVVEDTQHRGDAYLFYSGAHISGGALLIALVAGSAAEALEREEPGAAVERVMAWLRRVHEPRGITVPPPLQAACTRWGSDPWARGSYSSCRVGSLGADDYDTLAEAVGGRVFFAGEATTKKYPATMHGAFLSGLREAAHISSHFARQREAQAKAAGTAGAGTAAGREEEVGEAEVGEMQELVAAAREVRRMFLALEPDLELGFLQALWGPPGSPFQHDALVRIDLGSMRSSSRKDLVVFTAMGRTQVLALCDVAGGDEARLAVMTEAFGVKVLGRGELEPHTLELVAAIAAARGLQLAAGLLARSPNGHADPGLLALEALPPHDAAVLHGTGVAA